MSSRKQGTPLLLPSTASLCVQVVHSDLKVRNVLLKSDASGRGCVAKVADFGLAVRLDTLMDTHVSAFQVRWAASNH